MVAGIALSIIAAALFYGLAGGIGMTAVWLLLYAVCNSGATS
jgi:hypothetical protein